ncbi:MAG TPA: hydrogenase small subunit [Azospirillaceae bacterium]|nr:hydrogenase small subunit [Azospirillaceae bacterium]
MADGHFDLSDEPSTDIERLGDLDSYEGALGGLNRRDFLKYCTGIAATLGLSPAFGIKIAEAATSAMRPPVVWLSGQACTGCVESLLRAQHPTLETLILDQISLEYLETLNIGAGHQAENWKANAIKQFYGKYVLVVDGAIPTKDGGIYCKVAGHTFKESVEEAAKGAAAVIALGSCASWGGIPSAGPNPTGAVPAKDIVKDKPVVTIPGCPSSPYNFLSTVLHFIAFGKLPALDDKGRPKFAYGRLIHENCERRPHFDAGRFAVEFGDNGHRQGWCLYKLGCKGPETYNNCSTLGFGDVGESSWPVAAGHPCFGCSEKGVGFTKGIHQLASVQTYAPPAAFPTVDGDKGAGASTGSVAVAAGLVGAAVGAGAVVASRLGKTDAAPKDGE